MDSSPLPFIVIVLCFIVVSTYTDAEKVRYDRYRVIRLKPNTKKDLIWLQDVTEKWKNLDLWRSPSRVGQFVDILVPPERDDLLTAAAEMSIDAKILISDVQWLIDNETVTDKKNISELNDEFNYTEYHTFEEIDTWIDSIANAYSHIVSVETISRSYLGHPIRALKLGKESEILKPVAFIQGGIHAREWISPATVMFLTYKLLDAYGVDTTVTDMLDKFDWYIVPVLNPDGYEYTWNNDRLWRKNRRKADGAKCTGTDLNRNYDYKWGGTGASTDSCAETYRGPGPLSEPELIGVTDFLKLTSESHDIRLYIDFHSYGQLWLYPWGYTADRTVPQPDREVQRDLGLKAAEAIKSTHGESYFVGEAGPDLYPASGASDDWTYGQLAVRYTYTVELRDAGRYGFLLPAEYIQPTTEEIFAAMMVVGQKLLSEL